MIPNGGGMTDKVCKGLALVILFIGSYISSLAKEVKESKLDVSISRIIPGNDNWNSKVMEVNSYLTLIWVGFLGFRFEVGGSTHIYSLGKYTF